MIRTHTSSPLVVDGVQAEISFLKCFKCTHWLYIILYICSIVVRQRRSSTVSLQHAQTHTHTYHRHRQHPHWTSNDYLICCVTMDEIRVNFREPGATWTWINRYGKHTRDVRVLAWVCAFIENAFAVCAAYQRNNFQSTTNTHHKMRFGFLVFFFSSSVLVERSICWGGGTSKNSISRCGCVDCGVLLLLCKRKCVASHKYYYYYVDGLKCDHHERGWACVSSRDIIKFFINHNGSYIIIMGPWIACWLLLLLLLLRFPSATSSSSLFTFWRYQMQKDVGSMIPMSDVITEASTAAAAMGLEYAYTWILQLSDVLRLFGVSKNNSKWTQFIAWFSLRLVSRSSARLPFSALSITSRLI